MTMTENKPNYNEVKTQFEQGNYANSFDQSSNFPANYAYRSTDDFYKEEDTGASSFLVGALVGGVIGAAAALFLAPKTGREMREDFTTQASQFRDKSIELSTTAKEKASEFTSVAKEKTSDFTEVAKEKTAAFTSVAKEKTSGLTQTLQEQSGQLVDKVKSATSKTKAPLDDGTVSSEGEEATAYESKKPVQESGEVAFKQEETAKPETNEKVTNN